MKNIIVFLSNDGYDRGFFEMIGGFLSCNQEWKKIPMYLQSDISFVKNKAEKKWEFENVIIVCFKDHEANYDHPTVRLRRSIMTTEDLAEKIQHLLK